MLGRDLIQKGIHFMVLMMPKKLIKKFQDEIKIEMVPFQFMVYVPSEEKKIQTIEKINKERFYKTISGTKLDQF